MGLDYSLEVVFDNQSDRTDVLFKNVILFLLSSKMDILFLALGSFAVFQLSSRKRAQLLSLKTPDGFLFLLNFGVTTRQWNKTNLLITSPK